MEIKFNQSDGHGSLNLELVPVNKMKEGDLFLWFSPMRREYEIHRFHSDSGYGIKTFTNYKEDGSSLVVNYSGVCGRIILK